MERYIKIYLFLVLMISYSQISLSKELDWKMITLCASGAAAIVKDKMEEGNLGRICYKARSFIPECPDNTDEKIDKVHRNFKTRRCFQKCKENQVKIGNYCYYCDEGYQLIIEDSYFGRKIKKCENIKYKNIIIVKYEKPKEVSVGHCMKNTTILGNYASCELDCGVLGLLPFNDFCASNEEVYRNHQLKFIQNIIDLPLQVLLGKIWDAILKPYEIVWSQFGIMIQEFMKLLKLSDFNTNKWHIKADLKQRIKLMGRDMFSKFVTDFAVESSDDYAQYLATVCPKVSSHIYDNIINNNDDEELISSKEGFAHYSSLAIESFFKLFKIDKLKDITNECFLNIDNLNAFECYKSLATLIGDFDPTPISSIISIILSYYAEPCNIIVNPENSEEILTGYDILYDSVISDD